jgi:hypothetical protein
MSSIYALYDLEHVVNAPTGGWGPASVDPIAPPRNPTTQKVVPAIGKAVKIVNNQLYQIARTGGTEKGVGGLGSSSKFTLAKARKYTQSIRIDMCLTKGEQGHGLALPMRALVATREHFDASLGGAAGTRGDNTRQLTWPDLYHERHEHQSGLGQGKVNSY